LPSSGALYTQDIPLNMRHNTHGNIVIQEASPFMGLLTNTPLPPLT
jgi:hypothetical protein